MPRLADQQDVISELPITCRDMPVTAIKASSGAVAIGYRSSPHWRTVKDEKGTRRKIDKPE